MLFGPAPVSVDKLIATILANFPFGAPKNDQARAIKRALDELGRALNYTVFFSDNGDRRHDREWMLDLVWWSAGTGTVAAMKCDWGNAGSVVEQFHRLMGLKAPLKVMVFSTRQAGAERPDVLQRKDTSAMLHALGTCAIDFRQHVNGEHYLLLELVEEENLFRGYELFVTVDGKLGTPFDSALQVFRRLARDVTTAA
jgi:hypothetical protein